MQRILYNEDWVHRVINGDSILKNIKTNDILKVSPLPWLYTNNNLQFNLDSYLSSLYSEVDKENFIKFLEVLKLKGVLSWET